ncbi:hypothetical protein SARC_10770 [Sphaeroforma arctica JP610]|uniref:C-CAP/cofactor C-like domain-containing protein n=1 Tax=Sphaeroforma arctica JP610 TaxID=667725 RepID=A0A0L0FL60_9EUKA|nr:hypothetical protein SARC_10770 [Sphaeroforma arctica JP610]KNC76748.1 hypothetical protein SARC_10770 [Sphaeroforma arctica JP610]|eukprot:XP_014150650.1 hypothetical protein SARC_10770 [Sphaeroforma arctica JP610]
MNDECINSSAIELPAHLLQRQIELASNAKRDPETSCGTVVGGDWKGQSTAKLTESFWNAFDTLAAQIATSAQGLGTFEETQFKTISEKTCRDLPHIEVGLGVKKGSMPSQLGAFGNSTTRTKLSDVRETLLEELSQMVSGHVDILAAYDMGRAQKRLKELQAYTRKDIGRQSNARSDISTTAANESSESQNKKTLTDEEGYTTADNKVAAGAGGRAVCLGDFPTVAPAKKKFAFKSRTRVATNTNSDIPKVSVTTSSEYKHAESTAPAAQPIKSLNDTRFETDINATTDKTYSVTRTKIAKTDQVSINVQWGEGREISLSGDELSGEVCLSHLRDCTVYLNGRVSTLRVRDVVGCRIYTGVVTQSVMVFDTKDSTVQTACGQLRIHDTIKTDFFLLLTSHPIIEDCSELRFGRYTYDFEGNEADIEERAFDRNSTLWREVLDFKWQHPGKPSPNWKLYADTES